MDPVRYRPGEAIRWLQTGASRDRVSAQQKGRELARIDDPLTIQQGVRTAAAALLKVGKGALTELAHRQAEGTEFILYEDRMEIVHLGSHKVVMYEDIKRIEHRGDRTTVVMPERRITIKPQAYIVAGRLRVPLGWERNGMEVPFELLIDELCARADQDLEER